jgi:uncharacterized protein (TIGR03067 family)
LLLSLISSLAVVAVQDSANDKDMKVLQGKWEFVSYLVEGHDSMPKEAGWKWVFYIDGDKIKHELQHKDGRVEGVYIGGKFILDAAKVPKWIFLPARKTKGALIVPSRPGAPGIYELKGDELRICVGEKRPTEFSSTEQNGQMLIVAKRVKK